LLYYIIRYKIVLFFLKNDFQEQDMHLVLKLKGVIMYLLTAIFSKSCLGDVLQDLQESNIEGITISDVSGKGSFTLKETEEEPHLNENIRVDIVVSNDKFKELVKEIIRSNTQELSKGSGKMWVTPVLEIERIRTGEINEAALSHSSTSDTSTHSESYYTIVDTPAS